MFKLQHFGMVKLGGTMFTEITFQRHNCWKWKFLTRFSIVDFNMMLLINELFCAYETCKQNMPTVL